MDYIKILMKVRTTPEIDVYKGQHILTNKLFNLKEIKQNVSDQGIPASAIREISLLKELQHPNIIHLQHVFIKPMTVVLMFEYVHMDLKTYLQRLPNNFVFAGVAIKSYVHQITGAIAFCHQRRIFHRNLCPQNILLTRKGVIKVTDFDAARPFDLARKVYTHNVTSLWYRSPEILLGTSQYTPKIDIWSIGCIFGEIFLRRPLFQGDSEIGQIHEIAKVLGMPNKKTWSELNNLPYYFSELSVNKENRLKFIIKAAKNIEIHLMKQMLQLNPLDRISAKRILDHQYFLNFNKNQRVPTIF